MLSPTSKIVPGGVFRVTCYGVDGDIKWQESYVENEVTNAGLHHFLDVVFKGGTQITAWKTGLKEVGTPSSADTMASHAGWSEFINYIGGRRKAYTTGSISGNLLSNSASMATFKIKGASPTTITGAFLCDKATIASNDGLLLSVADFTIWRSCASGDTLEVQYDFGAENGS